MPRYFFHVRDGKDYPDLQGTELAGINEARREAARFAGALLASEPDTFWQAQEWVMRVADEHNVTLLELTFFVTDGPSFKGAPAHPSQNG